MTIDIEILQFLHYHPLANRAEIMAGLTKAPSDSTMKRLLSAAVKERNIETAGATDATQRTINVPITTTRSSGAIPDDACSEGYEQGRRDGANGHSRRLWV